MTRFVSWLNEHIGADDRITRAKKFIVLFVCVFTGVGLVANYLVFVFRHDDVAIYDHVFLLVAPSVVALAAPKYCIESKDIEKATNYVFGAGYLVILANTIHAGSTITAVVYFLLALSVCYSMLFGWRGLVIAAFVSAAHLVFFLSLEEQLRFDFTLAYRHDEITTTSEIIATLKSYLIVFLTASSCAAAFHHQMSKAVHELAGARKTADEANAAKSQFLANMSHDIRTPMSGVIGMLEILRRAEVDQTKRAHAAMALKSARDLMSLLDDIIDAAQLESAHLSLDREPTSVTAIVDDVVALFGALAREKSLTLTSGIATSVPDWVKGDPRRLRQVLTNLVGNAVKFTESGSVKILVSYDADDCVAHFAVQDTGVGMDDYVTNKIFDRFFQAESSEARRRGGSGLGLAICKQLVAMMGGEIRVDSKLGVGSAFHFSILAPISVPPSHLPSEPRAETVKPLRILVAEDNPAMQHILRTLLEGAGHHLTVVPDGRAAVAMVASGTFDVVLMDATMPVMDGPTATQRIRELGGRAGGIPIIALTANALEGDRDRYLEIGMTDYMSKPIDVGALFEVLGRVAARS